MNSLARYIHLACLLLAVSPAVAQTAIESPTLTDERLQVTLYASDPQIVTPIGCTVDAQGRLFVIECHTHNPPPDYVGPKGDVIKVFEGQRADGRFESMRVFADGLFQAQSLAFDQRGTLYVVCTREVLILHDVDGDLQSESRTRILHLDPYEKRGNPHGQMQGIAFSNDGWLYVGTGTTEDDWISRDGRRLSVGPYWGGIIARCRPDGTDLERIAWGFWNPYAITFDHHGRLLGVDNDPDHRGPNRLLHIVPGGDYGYKRTYGRYGLHPYQAWNGELPGTLPMIAGIGEAPTAILNANDAALPPDYRDTVIGASWGEHNLTLFRTKAAGASLAATSEIMLQGAGHDNMVSPFRPSGMAASPLDGSIYVADWLLIDYTTHGRGRIWKVTAKPGVETDPPRKPFSKQEPTPEFARLLKLTATSRYEDYALLRQALLDTDPYIRNAAVTALARPLYHGKLIQDLEHVDAKTRLGALLALRRAGVPDPAVIVEPRLGDPDPEVVKMAMIWAGEEKLTSLAEKIDQIASRPGFNREFFQAWLATMHIMEQAMSPSTGSNTPPEYSLQRQLSPAFIEQLTSDETRPTALRAMALRLLQDLDTPSNHAFLKGLVLASEPELRIEAIRRLAESAKPQSAAILLDIARDVTNLPDLRMEAIAALAGKPDVSLAALLAEPDPRVQLEAARSLRKLSTDPAVQDAARKGLERLKAAENKSSLRSQLEFLIAPESVARPSTVADWQQLLAEGGDPEAGQRVFFSANSTCITCHSIGGRGIKLGSGTNTGFFAMPFGPDLSVIARTADRNAIVHSIVKPSDYIAPEYQGWYVLTQDGKTIVGREIDQEKDAIQLIVLDGHEHNIPRGEIESWGAMNKSLMPDELAQTMAIEELRDLVAFLSTLR